MHGHDRLQPSSRDIAPIFPSLYAQELVSRKSPFFESAPSFSHNTTRLDGIAGAWVIDCRSRQGYNGCIILALCEHAEAAQGDRILIFQQ